MESRWHNACPLRVDVCRPRRPSSSVSVPAVAQQAAKRLQFNRDKSATALVAYRNL